MGLELDTPDVDSTMAAIEDFAGSIKAEIDAIVMLAQIKHRRSAMIEEAAQTVVAAERAIVEIQSAHPAPEDYDERVSVLRRERSIKIQLLAEALRSS